MNVEINTLPREKLSELISSTLVDKLPTKAWNELNRVFDQTTVMWAGIIHGKVKAVWGLVPPVMISDCAYLWLHMVEPLEDQEFLFVRNSQRALEAALERYPVIIGHCLREDKRAQRWIKWLGGVFDQPQNNYVTFTIRAKHESTKPH